MDIKNIEYVRQLLSELDCIKIVKNDVNDILNTTSDSYYTGNAEYLGKKIMSLIKKSPLFGTKLINLLENEIKTIEDKLIEL